MKIGLQVTDLNMLGASADYAQKLSDIARAADDMGFFSLWVPDHLLNAMSVFGQPIDAPMLEGYSTISYLAALTKRIKVGLLVTCNVLRHPSILVKSISTVDVLSSGRAYLGIGAGWFEREAKGLGMPFPPLLERFERLEETLQIAKHMWRGDTTPYHGKYYHLQEPINSPQPLSKPHPPILIGGGGEKKTLKFVAKYGDACNFFIGSRLTEFPESWGKIYENRVDFLRKKLAILKQHCNTLGRSYDDIEKTVQTYIKLASDAQNSKEIISLCHDLAELNISHVIFNMPNVHEIEPIKIVGSEIIQQIKDF